MKLELLIFAIICLIVFLLILFFMLSWFCYNSYNLPICQVFSDFGVWDLFRR